MKVVFMNLKKLGLPAQLVFCVVFGLLFAQHLPMMMSEILYSISCSLKDILMFFLPFVIMAYMWTAVKSFGSKGPVLILMTCGLIILANSISLLSAYGIGSLVLPHMISSTLEHVEQNSVDSIRQIWSLKTLNPLPTLQPLYGTIMGTVLGLLTVQFQKMVKQLNASSNVLDKMSVKLRAFADGFLMKVFVPTLPFYILGFIIKLKLDGQLNSLLQGYAQILGLIYLVIAVYLFFWYNVGAGFNLKKAVGYMKNMVSPILTGFTTMSSTAAMPLTLDAMKKNTQDENFSNFFVPSTVNAHLAGDGICITLSCMALLLMTGKSLPDFAMFLAFMVNYCLVKFSAAGVPGGGVLVILPVAKEYLGLDDTLTSILQTIYMLQDPFITPSNILGNGAFGVNVHRFLKGWFKDDVQPKAVEVLETDSQITKIA